MKQLSTLLTRRGALLQQARLANLAFAYETLGDFARRIARAQLRGAVALKSIAPEEGRFYPSLSALEGSQSVIEEHFSDEDLLELADVIEFATGTNQVDFMFRLEDLADEFIAPLRAELEREGVIIDGAPQSVNETNRP